MIETTIALKAKDSDWRSEMHRAPNYDIKPTEEHVPWSFCKIPSMTPFSSYLSFHFFHVSSFLKLSYNKMDLFWCTLPWILTHT